MIEVAQSSLQKDLNLKKAIYAEAQIREYWVLNLAKNILIVFREPQAGNYRIEQEVKQTHISSIAFPEVQILAEKLLSE